MNNQKIVVFDDLVCEKNQNDIINYFINGRHKNCCVIYLTQTFYKVPKNIRDNCSHFCIFRFLPRENKRIADEIGVDHDALNRATDGQMEANIDMNNNTIFNVKNPTQADQATNINMLITNL